MKTEPELTLEWCDEIWRQVPQEARKSVAESVKWVIEQDRARLQSSPDPVAGGVPEPDLSLCDWAGCNSLQGVWEDGWREALTSRLPAIKTGEVGG